MNKTKNRQENITMDVKKILEEATLRAASDIFIIAGRPLTYKTMGIMNTLDN